MFYSTFPSLHLNGRICKPQQNILVDDDGVARLADFGIAKYIETDQRADSTIVTSLHWTAPEYLENSDSDDAYHKPMPAADIWSFGCTFLEASASIFHMRTVLSDTSQPRFCVQKIHSTPTIGRRNASREERDHPGRKRSPSTKVTGG